MGANASFHLYQLQALRAIDFPIKKDVSLIFK